MPAAEDLDKTQIEQLQQAFDAFDVDHRGYLTPEMVGTILGCFDQTISQTRILEIVNEVDEDGSGQIEFEEFIVLAAKFLVEEEEISAEQMQEELREAFRFYDREGNGTITTDVLRELVKELDDSLTEEQLDQVVAEMDNDGSGALDFDEFMEVMMGED